LEAAVKVAFAYRAGMPKSFSGGAAREYNEVRVNEF